MDADVIHFSEASIILEEDAPSGGYYPPEPVTYIYTSDVNSSINTMSSLGMTYDEYIVGSYKITG